MPPSLRLDDFHHAIQAVFGWDDFHPHVFEVGERDYGPPAAPQDDEDEESGGLHDTRAQDEGEMTVGEALAQGPAGFTYLYNFAEDWRVAVTRAAAPAGACGEEVICTGGEHVGPQQEARRFERFSVEGANDRLREAMRSQATPEHPAGRGATAEQQLLANVTLAMLMLGSRPTRHATREAWKHVRTEVLDSLQEAGLIDTAPQRKSVTLTDAGTAQARRFLDRLR